ncbi:hypothetical protein JOF56_007068 [Kibdelosporangium banguiense]|uniref:Uncharacterized protein n=1 Tax=Kibdelosporangium banguiense TaxID=1365924 RepID=A0ABS4TQJ4_9PSEU|nr:hypothetical protein [Kibdelosporangium banguiense]MBP2326683.1 hypothetical protein [Kibdelosporangium banguiense]
MNTRLRRCLAVFGAAIVTVTLAASPGHAAEEKDGPEGSDPITDPVPGDFRSWDDLFAAQQQLNTAADTITNARDEQKDEGFSGVTAAPEERRVVLYWRGPVPPRVQEAVKEASRTAPVALAQSRYSEQELLSEGQALQSEKAVTGVAPNVDGSGLSVSVSVSEEEARALPAIKALRVPYVIFPFITADALAFNRQADIPPYWGGARWHSPSRHCSTGFAIRLGGTSAILGSGHCGNNGQSAWINGGAFMGPIINKNALRDTLAIRTYAAGRIYSGGIFSNLSIPVKGKQSSYVGNYTCNSGAFTGLRCVSRVTSVNNLILTNVGFMFPMVRATSISNTPAAGLGDSGGPVISYWNYALLRQALGKGTISAGSGRLGPCGISSQCYRTVYYADLTQTLSFYGATLQLG